MVGMEVRIEVRLVYFDDCPNWRLADARLQEALAGLGDSTSTVIYQLVQTPEEAEQAGFRGSPTILVNGRDPFTQPGDSSACRVVFIAAQPGRRTRRRLSSSARCYPVPVDGAPPGGEVAGGFQPGTYCWFMSASSGVTVRRRAPRLPFQTEGAGR
jgi:hypothetical protein